MKHAKHACNIVGVLGVVAKDANFFVLVDWRSIES
jgi:hypothetical protein